MTTISYFLFFTQWKENIFYFKKMRKIKLYKSVKMEIFTN